jgi:hypothetical protein
MTYTDSNAIGAHSAVSLKVDFAYNGVTGGSSTAESVRNVQTDMPAGALGDPMSVPTAQRCNLDYTAATTPDYSTCPASSKVGVADVAVYHSLLSGLLGIIHVTGSVYFLNNKPTPSPEIPGYVGIFIQPPTGIPLLNGLGINLTGKITARNKSDYGLHVKVLEDIPNQLAGAIRVDSLTLGLLKNAPSGNYFATNPTRCSDWTTSSYARSWGTNTSANEDLDPVIVGNDYFRSSSTITPNCRTMPAFSPGASITPTTSKAGEPAGMIVSLTRPNAPALQQQSHMKRVDITFPDGVEINPALASDIGSNLCTDAQFNKSEPDTPATCPASSEVATITTVLPLMSQPSVGKMYLGQPGPTDAERYRAFIDIPGNMGVKFEGRMTIDPDGTIHSSVGDETIDRALPQVPYQQITLVTKSGPRAAFVNPVTCGTHTGSVLFTPWSGQTPVSKPLTLVTDYDGAGAPCPAVRPFDPTFGMTPATATAGSHPGFDFTINRPDGDENIKSVAIALPQGLIAAPASADECSEAQLQSNACPASSEVGTVNAAAGTGPETLALSGKIFNIAPPSGEVAKLAAVVPAVVGPYDLGLVTLPLSLEVRGDLGATATSGDLPARVGGVAVRLRQISVHLNANADHGTFMRVPSRCGTHVVTATINSAAGQAAARTANLVTTGCAELPFDPAFSMTPHPDGANPRGDLPGWNIHLDEPAENSAIAALQLIFPKSVSSNLNAIANLCEDADFVAGSCPAGARLGSVRINTPLLPYSLDGDVLIVRAIKPGAVTPRVALSIDTPFKLRIPGDNHFINGSQVVSDFTALPDLPFSGIDINLKGGPTGIVQFVAADQCGSLEYTMTGHGGQNKAGSLPFGGQACSDFQSSRCENPTFTVFTKGRKKPKSAKFGSKLEVPAKCPAIQSLTIKLPKGTRTARKTDKKHLAVSVAGRRIKTATVKIRGRFLRIKNFGGDVRSVSVLVSKGAIRLPACKKKKPCWKRKLSFHASAEMAAADSWSGTFEVPRRSRILR